MKWLLLFLLFPLLTHAQINSLALIKADHDSCRTASALPTCLPSNFNWFLCPRVNAANPPAGAQAIFPWFVIFASGGKTLQSTNTMVQVRNISVYYLSKSQNKWILAIHSPDVKGYYNTCNTDTNLYSITPDIRAQLPINGNGTGITFLPQPPPFQGWTTVNPPFTILPVSDIGGVWVYSEARLILTDPCGVDDRNIANLTMCQGADWKTQMAGYLGDVGIGRWKSLTTSWQAYNMSTLTDTQWSTSPAPPVNAFD